MESSCGEALKQMVPFNANVFVFIQSPSFLMETFRARKNHLKVVLPKVPEKKLIDNYSGSW